MVGLSAEAPRRRLPLARILLAGTILMPSRFQKDRRQKGPASPWPLHWQVRSDLLFRLCFIWEMDCSRISPSYEATEEFFFPSSFPQGLPCSFNIKKHICSAELARVLFWVHEADLGPPGECEEGTALPKAGAAPEAGTSGLESAPAQCPFPSLSIFPFVFLFQSSMRLSTRLSPLPAT